MKSVLTKSQAAELLRAASRLPLSSRDQFITDVDKRLRVAKRPLHICYDRAPASSSVPAAGAPQAGLAERVHQVIEVPAS